MSMPFVENLQLNPPLTALAILVLTLVAAKVIEVILTRFLTRLTRRTKTALDDRAIHLLRRPIFLTVLFVGLGGVTQSLELSPLVTRVTLGILKTMMILMWMGAALPLVNLIVDAAQAVPDRLRWVDTRTAPLFNNLLKIAVVVTSPPGSGPRLPLGARFPRGGRPRRRLGSNPPRGAG